MGKELPLHGQEHLLRYYDELSELERRTLEKQIAELDWSVLSSWEDRENSAITGRIEPIEILTISDIMKDRGRYFEIGRDALQRGKVAAVLLAGGQGTRLGSNAPKGTYNIGITRPLYIFEQLVENLLSVSRACSAFPPLFIMTSEKNDAQTQAFFAQHDYFGYPRERIRFFVQKMAPCLDFTGKFFLEEKGRVATSPNGNGGWYASLLESGIENDFPEIEWYNVFGVDNVLQRIADPIFLGATILSGKNSGAKGVRKADPEEKVGVLCLRDGLPDVIEYYDLDEERANLRDREGNLVYSFGVTLNYLFRAKTLREISREKIPIHIVKKKVPFLDENGILQQPDIANGYKFETLILDLIRLMGSCLPFEVVREREFAPIKNRVGVDSVESARELLKRNGVNL